MAPEPPHNLRPWRRCSKVFRVLPFKVTSFPLVKIMFTVDGRLKSINSNQGGRRPCGSGLWLSAEL